MISNDLGPNQFVELFKRVCPEHTFNLIDIYVQHFLLHSNLLQFYIEEQDNNFNVI